MKTHWLSEGTEPIIQEDNICMVKVVGVQELRLLDEIKSQIKKGSIFHVTLESDSATLGQARWLLDELSSELDIHEVVVNFQMSPITHYSYLETIIREDGFAKVELSHSIKEPISKDLANFIIKIRDSVLLNWTEFRYGEVAAKIEEAEKTIFENERKRVQDLKSNEYRTYLLKWYEGIKKDLRTIKERLNKLEEERRQ